MPELPDLKVYSENIKKLILSKTAEEIEVYRPQSLDTDASQFSAGIKGSDVSDVYSQGKELFIEFSNSNRISIHLMLNGKCWFVSKADEKNIENKIMSISFDDGNCLSVEDFQYFCKISFNPAESEVPDVLSQDFTMDYFLAKAEQYKRKKVKTFLLDQKIMRGIGNAYADEILWKAKISPKSITGKIPIISREMLFVSIKSVMMWAISEIKKINPDMINGEERKFMCVHNPRLKFTKDRERIHKEVISSKKTYYTDSQVHYF